MSYYAKVFAEGYRNGPIKTEKKVGVEHLVPGQHEAIWSDDDHKLIELSYVNGLGHGFVVVVLDVESLNALRIAVVDGAGINEVDPSGWTMSEEARAAVMKLKTESALEST